MILAECHVSVKEFLSEASRSNGWLLECNHVIQQVYFILVSNDCYDGIHIEYRYGTRTCSNQMSFERLPFRGNPLNFANVHEF